MELTASADGMGIPRVGGVFSAVTGFLIPNDVRSLNIALGADIMASYKRSQSDSCTVLVDGNLHRRWRPFEPMLPCTPLTYHQVKIVAPEGPCAVRVEGLYTPPAEVRHEEIGIDGGTFLPYLEPHPPAMTIRMRFERHDVIIQDGLGGATMPSELAP